MLKTMDGNHPIRVNNNKFINVYFLEKIQKGFFKKIVNDKKVKNIYFNRKNFFVKAQEISDFYFDINQDKSISLEEKIDLVSIENSKDLNLLNIKSRRNLIQNKIREINKKNFIEKNIIDVEYSISGEILKTKNVFVSLDCEFYYENGKIFVKEIGLFKYYVREKIHETLHFNVTDKKIDKKCNHLTSLIKVENHPFFENVRKKLKNFLSDVEVVIGHAVNNDIKVLSLFDFKIAEEINKDVIIADTQKMFSLYYDELPKSLYSCADILNIEIANLFNVTIDKDMLKDIIHNNNKFFNNRSYKNFKYKDLILHNAFNDAFLTMMVYFKLIDNKCENESIFDYSFFDGFIEKTKLQYNQNIINFIKKNEIKISSNKVA